MITKRCTFNIVYEYKRRPDMTADQIARGFAAYGIHILNDIDFDRFTKADHAFAIAIREYTIALGCMLESPEFCTAPVGFIDAITMHHKIEKLVKGYYSR